MASLYEKQIARNQATKDFRTKWGGVISPKYTEGADLASNKFVGTASQKDVIESLLSSGTSGNLAVWVKENKIDVDSLADTYTMSSWKTPIKQTALREELALQTAYSKPSTNLTSNVGQVFTNISLPAIARAQPRGAGRVETPELIQNETQQIEKVIPPNMKEAAVNENPVASVMMPEPQPVTEITEEKKLNPLLLIGGLAALGIVGFLLIRRMKK
tara:strand:+ start:1816 stop:2463 length:648 start_codon:yes stop_codon:yes gene_type:complete